MARSHQRGTVRLEHNSWVGYMNRKVLDPTTGESKWKKQRVGVLGAKSKMTKHQAQDSLEEVIAQRTGGSTQPRADERIVTLGWFTRNRFFPLREGSTWNEGTAASRKSDIERDLLGNFGEVPMEQIDKVMLQRLLYKFLYTPGRISARVFLWLKAHPLMWSSRVTPGTASSLSPKRFASTWEAICNAFRTVNVPSIPAHWLRLYLVCLSCVMKTRTLGIA
ncbi:MAG TPA: hypothetical protein VFE61_22340 [Candidatus Sulfotelmatobacter sp.]|nr:hypothetical protein [Candidatus Sulfotelmatobacter sp.]